MTRSKPPSTSSTRVARRVHRPTGPVRRGPGRPRSLTVDDVIDAAAVIVRDDGPAALSMRSLARVLGVPPMTIYGYVPNKETLDDLVVDRLLADVPMPEPSVGPWDRRLHTLLSDVRATLAERLPLVAANAALGPGSLQLLEHGA
jgi:AcrR family transcriptional regulator